MQELEVLSTAFDPESDIPADYTCDGADHSPPLRWTAGPPGTESYALVMLDLDAPMGSRVHWVAWNLTGNSLEEDAHRRGRLVQGMNSWGRVGYTGPAPPSGRHRYVFRVYALDAPLELGPGATKEALFAAMAGHVLAEGKLTGRYGRAS